MLTKKLNPVQAGPKWLSAYSAGKILRQGGVIAFPTETVYGLGANALSAYAVKKLFILKKRPLKDPLIVHVCRKNDLYKYAKVHPFLKKSVNRLMKAFWPGPLTLVLEKKKNVPDIVTSGLDTVGVRMPADRQALKFIRVSGCPVAAPSANLFGRPSSTSSGHVRSDFPSGIDGIIEGGISRIGIESTVLDLSGENPVILRHGAVTSRRIEKVLGLNSGSLSCAIKKISRSKSPGMLKKHYAPLAKLALFDPDSLSAVRQVKKLLSGIKAKGQKAGLLVTRETLPKFQGCDCKVWGHRYELPRLARSVFSRLRSFDRENYDFIFAETVDGRGLGEALMERLIKASASRKIIR